MKQIDWSEAPEWANVYLQHVRCDSHAWAESHKDGARALFIREDNLRFELLASCWAVVGSRPTTQQWNGEGLPPVGIKCEFYIGSDEWCRAFTVGIDDDGCMVVQTKNNGYKASLSPLHFRPIRTPEQIAAEEREAAIKEIGNLIASVGPTFRDQATRIYDAGYRKPNA